MRDQPLPHRTDRWDVEQVWQASSRSRRSSQPTADANVQAWLVTIAHRKAIDVTRAAARRAIPVAETPDTSTGAAADSRDLDLAAALSELPDKQKQAVAYHYLAGLPYANVAPSSAVAPTPLAAQRPTASTHCDAPIRASPHGRLDPDEHRRRSNRRADAGGHRQP